MRSSRLQSRFISSLILAALLAPCAYADKNDDLYNKGTAAANANDLEGAKNAFCAIDKSYKDAASNCSIYTDQLNKQNARYSQNFIDGGTLLSKNPPDFDGAAIKFRNVKSGPYAEAAKQQLDLIPKLKADYEKKQQDAAAAQSAAAADQQLQQKLNDANAAFVRGEYATAKALLTGVGGKFAGQAQDLQNRIAQAESAKASATQTPTKPAVRETPHVDVERLLTEADTAARKKNNKLAKSLYRQVLAADNKNQRAIDGINALPDDTATASASEEDQQLAGALADFYRGDLSSLTAFEVNMKSYLFARPPKKGLATFYLGASIASRYYLNGARPEDERLLQDAKARFKEASAVDGFVPPEKFVSPKIMKLYHDAVGS